MRSSRIYRTMVALIAVGVMLVGASGARADSMMTPATRDGAGQGADASAVDDHWTFTVAGLQGKPAQVIIRLTNKVTGQVFWAGFAHPVVGGTVETYQPIPAGVYDLRANIWGGPPHLETSVTLSVDTP